MITCTSEPITPETERKLREWMAQAPSQTLLRVVRSMTQEAEVKVLNEAVQGADWARKIDAANGHLLTAQKYQAFLSVWNEIIERKGELKTVRLS